MTSQGEYYFTASSGDRVARRGFPAIGSTLLAMGYFPAMGFSSLAGVIFSLILVVCDVGFAFHTAFRGTPPFAG